VRSSTLVISLFMIACSAPHGEHAAELRAAVLEGSASPPSRDQVVFVHVEGGSGTWNDCTGTLIAPRAVVTAKHCVAAVPDRTFVCSGEGELLDDGAGAGVFGAPVEASSVQIYLGRSPIAEPAALGKKIFETGSFQACRDDLAVVVLDRAIELPTYSTLPRSPHTQIGDELRLVGYGTGQHTGLVERRELPNVRVTDVDSGLGEPSTSTPRRSFVVDGNTVCIGDSGGPALSMDGDTLIGVYSRITGDCLSLESRNTFMLVAGYLDLLEEALNHGGGIAYFANDDQGPEAMASAGEGTQSDGFNCALGGRGAAWGWPLLLSLFGLASLRRARARPARAARRPERDRSCSPKRC
jgi:hypothetical protein